VRLTRRDVSVIRDLALSHVLSRDQLLRLGYFGSITRVNSRLRELIRLGLVARLDTPFYAQSLYVATKRAAEVAGERVSPLILGRRSSPRFIQHALSVTNVRLALTSLGSGQWRFEQQLWRKVVIGGGIEVRPDGLFVAKTPVFVEVDMGHVAPNRFREKLASYAALAAPGRCSDLYGFDQFRLLTVTTGSLRARHLRRLQPPHSRFELLVQTFEEVGATFTTAWS
jgi:hypothetical protein